MNRPIDIVGQRFGALVVTEHVPGPGCRWHVVCDCGERRIMLGGNLRQGRSTSCGRCSRSGQRAGNYTHGLTKTPEYRIWTGIVQRCTNPKRRSYAQYGGRGIGVCATWRDSFEAFLRDMGPRPSAEHSVEREDNDKGYEPGNCHWATLVEQARNRRSNVNVTIDGRTMCVTGWIAELGLVKMTVWERIWRGWDPVRAITEPTRRAA